MKAQQLTRWPVPGRSKTQDKSPQEDDEQESRIPARRDVFSSSGEGEEIAANTSSKEATKLSKLTGRVRLVRLILLLKMAITLCLLRSRDKTHLEQRTTASCLNLR